MRGIAAVLFLALAPADSEERGRFRLSHQGREAGFEEYRLEAFDTGSVVLFAKAKYELEIAGGLKRPYLTDTVLTMDAAFAPALYAGLRKAGREEDQVKIEWSKGVALAGRRQVKTQAAHLVDSTVTAHLIPLVRGPAGKGRRKFRFFNPNGLADVEGFVEERGEGLLRGRDAALKVRDVQVGLGYLSVHVHVDEKGRILRAWSPASGMLAELEGFEGWTPEGLPPDGVEEADVTLAGPAGRLAGALLRPRGTDKIPAVLLLSGSGPQDRHGNLAKGKGASAEFAWAGQDLGLLRELARALGAAGIASLRLDDRGCGGSEGDSDKTKLSDLRADAAAALAWLKARPDLGPVGIVAHEEGALLGLELPGADALVMLAAPAGPLDELLLARAERQLREQGLKDEALDDLLDGQKRLFKRIRESSGDVIEIDERPTFVAWMRERFLQKPEELLARSKVPAAAFHGGKDRQVPPAALERLRAARPDLETRLFEGLDHGFGGPEGRVHDAFLSAVSDRAAALLRRK